MAGDRLDHRVDVIRHDAPGQEAVPRAVEVEQGRFHHGGDAGLAKAAGANAPVQPPGDPSRVVDPPMARRTADDIALAALEDILR